jgi:hypothetical protein
MEIISTVKCGFCGKSLLSQHSVILSAVPLTKEKRVSSLLFTHPVTKLFLSMLLLKHIKCLAVFILYLSTKQFHYGIAIPGPAVTEVRESALSMTNWISFIPKVCCLVTKVASCVLMQFLSITKRCPPRSPTQEQWIYILPVLVP